MRDVVGGGARAGAVPGDAPPVGSVAEDADLARPVGAGGTHRLRRAHRCGDEAVRSTLGEVPLLCRVSLEGRLAFGVCDVHEPERNTARAGRRLLCRCPVVDGGRDRRSRRTSRWLLHRDPALVSTPSVDVAAPRRAGTQRSDRSCAPRRRMEHARRRPRAGSSSPLNARAAPAAPWPQSRDALPKYPKQSSARNHHGAMRRPHHAAEPRDRPDPIPEARTAG